MPWWCCMRASTASEPDLLDWCRSRMAGFKRPQAFSFMAEAEMPRTATGKILHRVLRDRLSAQLASQQPAHAA